jgi:hypothetical protein
VFLFRRFLVWAVACLLACGPAAGQQPSAGQRLRIIPLEVNNAVNYIPLLTATPPVVEVRDENERPLEGAAVTFRLPASGPGANFGETKTTQTGVTDARGQVGVTGYTLNKQPGRFVIEVTATHEGRTGRLLMTQTNSAEKLPPEVAGNRGSGKLKWILLGVAAGAGASLGIYFGTRGNTAPISVGTGPVVIGGPR